MDPILVTGGTGTLGRHVVRRLRDAGRAVRILTRRTGTDEAGVRFVTGDLLDGTEVAAAVAGVGTIIHCAGSNKGDEVATQNLVSAAMHTSRPMSCTSRSSAQSGCRLADRSTG
jgi:nucleoside-diphosphate-sugar epimerase